jgi:hypothetical protein
VLDALPGPYHWTPGGAIWLRFWMGLATVTSTVGRYWRPQMPGGGDHYTVFRAEIAGGEAIVGGPETAALSWTPVDAVPRAMHRFTREIIRDAVGGVGDGAEREPRMPVVEQVFFHALFRMRDGWNGWRKRRQR